MMDAADIFVYALSATYLGLIVFLAVLSRRQSAARSAESEDKTPRKAA
jgi:hypothetical protein